MVLSPISVSVGLGTVAFQVRGEPERETGLAGATAGPASAQSFFCTQYRINRSRCRVWRVRPRDHLRSKSSLQDRPGTVANHFFAPADPGSLINVAGIGLLGGAEDADAALAFAHYLGSDEAQEYFATETLEYLLIAGLMAPEALVPLSEIGHRDTELP
jgi:hypothetical protein